MMIKRDEWKEWSKFWCIHSMNYYAVIIDLYLPSWRDDKTIAVSEKNKRNNCRTILFCRNKL